MYAFVESSFIVPLPDVLLIPVASDIDHPPILAAVVVNKPVEESKVVTPFIPDALNIIPLEFNIYPVVTSTTCAIGAVTEITGVPAIPVIVTSKLFATTFIAVILFS